METVKVSDKSQPIKIALFSLFFIGAGVAFFIILSKVNEGIELLREFIFIYNG